MPKLIALTPINHDGELYAVGDEINVKDKVQAAALVDSGSALEAGKAAANVPTDPAP